MVLVLVVGVGACVPVGGVVVEGGVVVLGVAARLRIDARHRREASPRGFASTTPNPTTSEASKRPQTEAATSETIDHFKPIAERMVRV